MPKKKWFTTAVPGTSISCRVMCDVDKAHHGHLLAGIGVKVRSSDARVLVNGARKFAGESGPVGASWASWAILIFREAYSLDRCHNRSISLSFTVMPP